MIYHWRRGPKNTEVTPLQRPGSGSYACTVHRWLLAQCWRGVAKGDRKRGRECVKKIKITLYVQTTLSLTLSFSFSLSPSFFFVSPCSALGNFQLTVCPGPWYLTGRLMLFLLPPLTSPEYDPFMFYTHHTHMLTHTLTQSH